MALPTPEKTWRFNINRKRANDTNLNWHRFLLLDIKNAFIGDGNWDTDPTTLWTVDHSCDSEVAGTPGDGVDRWTLIEKLDWDRPGDPHSWIVLNTGLNAGAAQLLIDLDNENNATAFARPESIAVYFSWTGVFTGGTTTNRPTAADEQIEMTRGRTQGAWAGNVIGDGLDTAWHMLMSDDGAEMRLFLCRNNLPYAFWALGEAGDLDASYTETRHWGTVWSADNQSTDCCRATNNDNSWLYYLINGLQGAESAICRPVALNHFGLIGNIWANGTVGGIGDETLSEAPFGDLWLWNARISSAGERGPKGRMKDIWMITDQRVNGDTFPLDGSRQFHKIGANIVIPWNGTIPENTF